ncbi:MAG: cupredoxin domain-containing protein [Candidatus Blackburnbacteria bacterium]|nr:cupredoxin domain-containing protein [Candidatus Blackburnbacteria bacterium]
MSIDKIIVTSLGFFAALFVYWFFLGKKEQAVQASSGEVDVTVSGGYKPEVVEIPKGKTTLLRFTRTDPSSCLEELLIPDFKVRRELPLGETVNISITPKKAGEFVYSCGMNMYHGKIVVK